MRPSRRVFQTIRIRDELRLPRRAVDHRYAAARAVCRACLTCVAARRSSSSLAAMSSSLARSAPRALAVSTPSVAVARARWKGCAYRRRSREPPADRIPSSSLPAAAPVTTVQRCIAGRAAAFACDLLARPGPERPAPLTRCRPWQVSVRRSPPRRQQQQHCCESLTMHACDVRRL
jgi:hypothetical protein